MCSNYFINSIEILLRVLFYSFLVVVDPKQEQNIVKNKQKIVQILGAYF